MRLTAFLCHLKKKDRHIPYMYRGKNRIVVDPKPKDLHKLRIDFERTERNMLILRHPYLTKEQSHGHAKLLKTPKNMGYINYLERNEKYEKHFAWNDQLCHLRCSDSWE